jgi:hypothetical protein
VWSSIQAAQAPAQEEGEVPMKDKSEWKVAKDNCSKDYAVYRRVETIDPKVVNQPHQIDGYYPTNLQAQLRAMELNRRI